MLLETMEDSQEYYKRKTPSIFKQSSTQLDTKFTMSVYNLGYNLVYY